MPRALDRAPAEEHVDRRRQQRHERKRRHAPAGAAVAAGEAAASLERRRIDAGDRAQLEAGLCEQFQVNTALSRSKHRRIAMLRDTRGRSFEQHHASSGRQMLRHALHGCAQRIGIEDVLQHRDAEHEIELLARIELRQVLHQKAAAARDAVGIGAPPASAIIVGLKSMPVTCAPRAASSELQRPTPQPTSSTRVPGSMSNHGSSARR